MATIDEGIRALEIEPTAIKTMMDEVRETGFLVVDEFPLSDGSTIALELREAKPFAPDAKLIFQSSTDPATARVQPAVLPEDVLILTGSVAGEPDSFAMLALSNEYSYGLVQHANGTAVVSSPKTGGQLPPVVYDPQRALGGILQMGEWRCHTDTSGMVVELDPGEHDHDEALEGGLAGDEEPYRCTIIKVALEFDYEMWETALDADVGRALFYTAMLIASTNEIYNREVNFGIQLSNIRVWEEADDPWTQNVLSPQLTQFREWYEANGNAVDRDVAVLCSARVLGGGIAYIGGLCNDLGYAFCGSMNGTFPYPLQDLDPANWDITVFTHELAHTFGSIHTEDFCPPLDLCEDPANFGACQDQQVCDVGTIMSACHLCGDGGESNIHMGFHENVAIMIAQYVQSQDCLLDDETDVFAYDDTVTARMNTPLLIDAVANDTSICSEVRIWSSDLISAAGGTIEFSLGTGPFGRNQLIYQPPLAFLGEDSFEYTCTEGHTVFDTATVSINVTPQANVDDVLVTDLEKGSVERFDATTGKYLGALIPPGLTEVNLAQAVATGPEGNLLLANFADDTILRFDSHTGAFQDIFYYGDLINGPNDLASDGEFVYMSSKYAHQVVVAKADGSVEAVYPVGSEIADILLEAEENRLFVAWHTETGNGVQIWNTASTLLEGGFSTPELTRISSICRLDHGELLVADWTGERIGSYDGETHAFGGWYLDATSSAAYGVGQPNRIEQGPNGLVYVTSPSGLHQFTASGAFLGTVASTAGADAVLAWPRGMLYREHVSTPGDLDDSGVVDGADLSILLGNWNTSGTGDIDGNGIVNGSDLAILLGNWG